MNKNLRQELTCNALDTYSEVLLFVQNPPAWRSLCKELKPHSTRKIKNIEINLQNDFSRTHDEPEYFCHVVPDADEVERHKEKNLPKTLVCHDMANGYHDDSLIDGTGNFDAYTFYNWAGIDIFCYFSHHLITIPPCGWINVGHDHGVKVIGTVITEWSEGVNFWEEILETEDEYKNFASALVAIAKTLKFDGWLLNIENKIEKPQRLLEFVRHLHSVLHQELREPVLIWYDSVTVDGHLNWQNALNDKNKDFFEACDGLFTNYAWSAADVAASAAAAGARLADLYIGIDVWGRNFFGGGQFNVQEAVQVAYAHGCSLAVFAPAWTHEALTLDKEDPNAVALADELEPYEQFLMRDRALWDSVWRYLNTRLPCALPFHTSFCRGQGYKRRLYGEVICPVPWYNLRHQQYQPNSSHGPHGYLLSTIQNIVNASRTGILKDSSGVIKYTLSDDASAQLTSAPLKDEVDNEVGAAASTARSSTQDDTKATADAATETEDEYLKKLTLKRKIVNAFSHMFRREKLTGEETPQISPAKRNLEIKEQRSVHLDESPPEVVEPVNGVAEPVNSVAEPVTSVAEPVTSVAESVPVGAEPINGVAELVNGGQVSSKIEPTVEDEDKSGHMSSTDLGKADQSMVQMSMTMQIRGKEARTRYGLASVRGDPPCLEVYFEDSFIGGSCLKVNPDGPRLVRLLHCDFPCEDTLIFCVVTKRCAGAEEQFLNVRVRLEGGRGAVLVGRGLPPAAGPLLVASPPDCRHIREYLLLNEPGFYVPVENSYGWIVRYFEVDLPCSRVTAIDLEPGLARGPILLGYFGICEKQTGAKKPRCGVQP